MNRRDMRILLQLPNWLGDLVMSLGCVRVVGELCRGAQIEAIVRKELAELAEYFPQIKKVHVFDKQANRPLLKAYRYGRSLAKEGRYTHYLSLSRSFSTAWLGYALGAKARIGFHGDMRFPLMTHTYHAPKNMHRVEEYAYTWYRYLGELPQKLDTSLELPLAQHPILPQGSLRMGLNFNSASPSKTLPSELALSYLDALSEAYPEAQFFLLGSAEQRSYNASLLDSRPSLGESLHNYAGKTSLLQLGQLLTEVDLLISTDSGTAHLANSLGCALVILMGAGDEQNTGPYINKDLQSLRAKGIACAPCVSVTCKWGTPKCLEAITKSELLSATQKLLP